ncbi:MAG: parallel beta-helix domain-containing protein [Steroidobacter sp.]
MRLTVVLLLAVLIGGCSEKQVEISVSDAEFQKSLQLRLIQAKAGDVIDIPEGKWTFFRSLSLNRSDVTIRGAGPAKTVLSFKGQVQGAEGLIINAAERITVENLAIEDTKGDGLKANGCKDLTIRNVRVEWTNGPDERNGAYGLYPVQCERVLIEKSTVIGASDAGIYVGQSQHIIVRDNRAEFNVAGIEIENSTYADVYRNTVTNNTGGILVFNMPGLPVKDGRKTRVYENHIYQNNTDNFAPEGNIVATVPAGTGFMVLANDEIEFFNNKVENNQTANTLILSFNTTGKPANDPTFDPYPQQIAIYDNQFAGGGDSPDQLEMKAMRIAKFGLNGSLPDIIWDGSAPAGQGASAMQICIRNNGDADFANIDFAGDLKNFTQDLKPHDCELSPLAPVEWQTAATLSATAAGAE